MIKKLSTILILLLATAQYLSPSIAFAYTVPSFPSCVNPQGILAASYDDGVHGIAGNSAEMRGGDKVYQLNANEQVMQCFCPENGNGVQTNWIKVSTVSDEESKTLQHDGWVFIADGSAWGLDQAPYLAKNSDYGCKSTTTTSSNSTNTSVSNNVGSSNPIQSVLGLASTGNILFLYALATVGFVSLASGLVLKFKNK
jgi:hypothetical protein